MRATTWRCCVPPMALRLAPDACTYVRSTHKLLRACPNVSHAGPSLLKQPPPTPLTRFSRTSPPTPSSCTTPRHYPCLASKCINHHPSPPPDAHQVGPERYRAPECLFHPEQMGSEAMGVQDCLLKGIMRTDMDMRRTLFGQVVLSGGSTLFPGFGDRLLNEVGGGRVAVICVESACFFLP